MTLDEIQTALNALPPLMLEKGVVEPTAQLNMNSDAAPQIWLRNGDGGAIIGTYNMEIIRGKTVAKMFENARAHIAAMPDRETAIITGYNAKIADAIDYATANSLPDEYVTPLRTVRAAIYENLLPAPVSA